MGIYQRARNIYDPVAETPFKLSRTKLELFVNCPCCFYLELRLGIPQPPTLPFTLNSAVDALLKAEFDTYRKTGTPHPLMVENQVDAIPFCHERLDEWRDSLRRGIRFHHRPTNLILAGGIDDVWANSAGDLIIVDYKATAKKGEVGIDAPWQISYKRQIEIYQWLFRRNGFPVHPTAYFVYCNGNSSRSAFDGRLEFKIKLIPYEGSDEWVEDALFEALRCLQLRSVPPETETCNFCQYRLAIQDTLVQNGPAEILTG